MAVPSGTSAPDLNVGIDPQTLVDLAVAASGGGGATNLSVTRNATTVTVASDTGTDAVLPVATTSNAGVLSAADKTKLNGIATGATANTVVQSSGASTTNVMSQKATTDAIAAGAGQFYAIATIVGGTATAANNLRGSYLEYGNSAPGEFLLPNYLTAGIEPGAIFYVVQKGSQPVSVKPAPGSAGTGVTVTGYQTASDTGGRPVTTGLYHTLMVQAEGGNAWVVRDAYGPIIPRPTPADYGKLLGVNATTGAFEYVDPSTLA